MKEFLQTGDVARRLDLTPDGVRALVRTGRLSSAVTTPRGVKLFDPVAVERLRVERERLANRRTADVVPRRGSDQA
jgi:DNA-binding transcriptional MerR regulator